MGWQVAAAPASDGTVYNWYQQDKTNSCACASILMVARQMQGKMLGEDSVRSWCGKAEGGANITKEGVRDYDNVGTQMDIIGTVMSEKLGVVTLPLIRDATITREIKAARPNKPIVTAVYWYQIVGGAPVWLGGHAVVAVNYHANNIIFLDPEYGVFEVAEGDLNAYDINYGGGLSTGVIGGIRKH